MHEIRVVTLFLFCLAFGNSLACDGNANYLFDKLIDYAKNEISDTVDLRDYVKEYFQERKDGVQISLVLSGLKNFRRPSGTTGNVCFVLNGRKADALAKIEVFNIAGKGFVDFKRKIGDFRRKRSLVREKRWGWGSFVKAIEKAGDDIAAEVRRTPGNLQDIGNKIVAEVKRTPDNLKDIGDKIVAEVKRTPDNLKDIGDKVVAEVKRTPDNIADIAKKVGDEIARVPDNIADLVKSIRVDASVDFEVRLEYMRLRVGVQGDLETKKLKMTDYEVEDVRGFDLWMTRLGGLAYAVRPIRSILNDNIPRQRLVNIGKDKLKQALQKAIDNYTFDDKIPF